MATHGRKRVAFVGAANSRQGRVVTGSEARLLAEASLLAIASAGLKKDDIDGIVAPRNGGDAHVLAEHLGIYATALSLTDEAGAGGPGLEVAIAEWALVTGRCKYVLIANGTKES